MKKINYAYIANNILGDKLYCKFIKEVAKENKNVNLVDFGEKVFEKSCLLLVALGTSKVLASDKVKICIGSEIIEISCKEFAKKYNKYIEETSKEFT